MKSRAGHSGGLVLLPVLLVVIGILLLLWNFLLFDIFNPIGLLPLLLVALGAQILLRGDFIPERHQRAFGITRGSVQEASLEIQAADVDVVLEALAPEQSERLIAGQYAPQARPVLNVDGTHASLLFQRHQTSWSAMADWVMGLARDLPWRVYASTNTGQIRADFGDLILDKAMLASGLGDIHLILPYEAFEVLVVTSTMGNIHIITPEGYCSSIRVEGGALSRVQVDESRYEQDEAGNVYIAKDVGDDMPLVEVIINSAYGDVYIA